MDRFHQPTESYCQDLAGALGDALADVDVVHRRLYANNPGPDALRVNAQVWEDIEHHVQGAARALRAAIALTAEVARSAGHHPQETP